METPLKSECNGKWKLTGHKKSTKNDQMQRKMETDWAQKIYKKRSKTAELPFAHIKQNMKRHEFTTTEQKTRTQNLNYTQLDTI